MFLTPDKGRGPFPTVVMAGGWCYVKELVQPSYAEVINKSGIATLIIDYRRLGESGGEPRQHIDPWDQNEDYKNAIGLGHAVLVTKNLVGDQPFAVVLGDDIFDATPPALKQMMDVFDRAQGPVIAVERVAEEDVSSYGIVAVEPAPALGKGVYRILDMVEKPPRAEAPSNLAIIGRYLLTPDIFAALEATASDRSGEIQLTNGLRRLLATRPLYALEVDGVRHDAGNKMGFLKAMVYFALRRPDLAEPFRKYLAEQGLTR
jgi:UTP--glucose-1-phosphate uridylyltransferase